MREASPPDPVIVEHGSALIAKASTPQEALVQDLKSKLQSANVRERELHQHLLHHMQEKDSLVNQVAELQRVCEALLLSQMQEAKGPAAAAATAAATAALSSTQKDTAAGSKMEDRVKQVDINDVTAGAMGAVGAAAVSEDTALAAAGIRPAAHAAPPAPQPQHATSSSLKAIMGTVSSAPAPAPSPGLLPATPEVETPSSSVLKTMRVATAAPATVHERSAGTDPTIGVPQLLLERGGRIRITALWEAYQFRFGETQYSLKDLFSMIKAGAIPHVVHEPPAGIRLLPSAPLYQQRVRQLQEQLQRQQEQQRRHDAAFFQSLHHAQQQQGGNGSASPALSAASSGIGDGGNHVRHPQQYQHHHHQQHHQQQQHNSFPLPSSLASPRQVRHGQQNGPDGTSGIPGTCNDRISLRSASGESSPRLERPAAPAADGQTDTEYYAAPNITAAASENSSRGGGYLQFGSFERPPNPAAAAPNAGSSGSDDMAAASSTSSAGQRREVDWKELNRNLNLLLKEEGELNGRDLNHVFQQRFCKSPFLGGIPLRYAVSAGWLRGVCFDLSRNTYNLTVRVPVGQREGAPDGAPAYPPSQARRALHQDIPAPTPAPAPSCHEVDWKQLSSEFRQLLLPGALEPTEIHANYHHTFKKPLIIGAGYSMRQAVMDGRLGGVTFEPGSRRLMCV